MFLELVFVFQDPHCSFIRFLRFQPLMMSNTSETGICNSLAVALTANANRSGSSICIALSPFLMISGVPAFGVFLIEKQALFSSAINGLSPLTLGPSTFSVGMVVSSLSLLCGFASALFGVLGFKFAVSDSLIFISTARRDEFTPPADCWRLNTDCSGRSAHVVFVIGNHICLFQFWDKQNNALFVSFPNSNSKHFILQMQLGLPNSLFLGFCL